jgi:hypothetical protein
MIPAWLLMLQAVPTLGDLPPQSLPQTGCAAYLWSVGDQQRRMVAVAMAASGVLRLSLDGKAQDLARAGPVAGGPYGLEGESVYRGQAANVRILLDVVTREDLRDGAIVPSGTLTVERPGSDAMIVPVAGLVGCAPRPPVGQ